MEATELVEIECLACGDVREVDAGQMQCTGECPRCGYVGWSYLADLDLATQRMIQRGLLARAPRVWRRLRAGRRLVCSWELQRSTHDGYRAAPRRI